MRYKLLVNKNTSSIISIESDDFEILNDKVASNYLLYPVELSNRWYRELGCNLASYYFNASYNEVFDRELEVPISSIFLHPEKNDYTEDVVAIANELDPNNTYVSWADVCENFVGQFLTSEQYQAYTIDGVDFNTYPPQARGGDPEQMAVGVRE